MSNPQLPGIIQSAPNETHGFDADTVITSATAQQFSRDGYYKFCIRYISLLEGNKPYPKSPKPLDYDEAKNILEAGLALMPVQHVLESPWFPTAQLGKTHGKNAANNAIIVGFPPKVNVWLDLEGISDEATAQDVIDYCNAWFEQVNDTGYLPGLYVGYQAILTSEQLYYDLKFQHYWKSQSEVPPVAKRNYQMRQYPTITVNGISIDPDTTYIDKKNGVPQWLILDNNPGIKNKEKNDQVGGMTLEEQAQKIASLEKENQELRKRIAELESSLRVNSKNS